MELEIQSRKLKMRAIDGVGEANEVLLTSREGDGGKGGNSRTGEERSKTTEFLAKLLCCISCETDK